MAWEAAVVDLGQTQREFVTDYETLSITPQLNGYAEIAIAGVDPLSSAAAQISVAERALKLWQDGVLRFHGKIWEPLSRKPSGWTVIARDPLAEFAWRRVRDPATASYVAVDAGDIARDRVAVQNALRNTYLRASAANRQLSVNRTRSWVAGKREDEILQELADAANGYFYKASPVDGVAGVMADLVIVYPSAGANRDGARFAFGDGTADNVSDYEIVDRLPLNRFTSASGAAGGGRQAKPYEDAASITRYGLFEDEAAYSDTTDATLLQVQAQSQVKPDPIRTIQVTPTADAPLLYTDFNVGDFVRIRILWGADDLFEWARVIAATLVVDKDGLEQLGALTLELVTGGVVTADPDALFRERLDGERARLEALERKVELLTAATGASSAPPAAGSGDADPEPPPDSAPAPSQPAPPPDPPTVAIAQAYGESTTSIHVEIDANGNGVYTEATIWAEQGGVVRRLSGTIVVGSGSGHFAAQLSGLSRNSAYTIHARVSSSAGANEVTAAASTLNADIF